MFRRRTPSLVKSHGPISFVKQYFRLLRFYVVTGLLVWTPLIITVWLTWWLFTNVALTLEAVIESFYAWLNSVGERFQSLSFLKGFEYHRGLGLLTAIALFLTTGFLTRNLVGRRFIRLGERMLNRIPLISRIYQAVGQIRDVVVTREGAMFQGVVLVEYPRKGVYVVAFRTSEEQGVVQQAIGTTLMALFVPTTPNPTSGFLLYVPPEDITNLDISIEDAMKLIVSAGAYSPALVVDSENVDEN